MKHNESMKFKENKVYEFQVEIKPNSVAVKIDDKPYFSAEFTPGSIPNEGYFGFAVYKPNEVKVIKELTI